MSYKFFNYKLVKNLLIIASSVLAVLITTISIIFFNITYQFKNITKNITENIAKNEQQIAVDIPKIDIPETNVVKNTTNNTTEITSQEDKKPTFIDFQPTVDSWVASVGGSKSVFIYDLDLDQVAGKYNIDQVFDIASLYKLFVTYESYRRIQDGTWTKDDLILGITRLDCLKLVIKESHSPCAETLWRQIGHANMDQIIVSDYGINAKISSITSNVQGIADMMKLFYHHPHFNDELLVAIMQDSFLNQPITEYNWRGGLPSGFSENANVYNKVGWDWTGEYWRVYHDASIVEFPKENRHYVVVVLSSKISHKDISRFGTMLESAFYTNYQ